LRGKVPLFLDTLAVFGMSTPEKEPPVLPEPTERALLAILVDSKLSKERFYTFTRPRPDLFGESDSIFRKKVYNRRSYLLKSC
jgi:hypothetical protein